MAESIAKRLERLEARVRDIGCTCPRTSAGERMAVGVAYCNDDPDAVAASTARVFELCPVRHSRSDQPLIVTIRRFTVERSSAQP